MNRKNNARNYLTALGHVFGSERSWRDSQTQENNSPGCDLQHTKHELYPKTALRRPRTASTTPDMAGKSKLRHNSRPTVADEVLGRRTVRNPDR